MKKEEEQNNSIIDPDFWYNHVVKEKKIILTSFGEIKNSMDMVKLIGQKSEDKKTIIKS